jgi:hypothetical protein
MESKWLIILAIILFILILLNHVSLVITQPNSTTSEQSISNQFGYIQTPQTCSNLPGCCSLTQFGCCPDGINSRINQMGTNCPTTYSQGYTTTQTTTTTPAATIPPQNIIKPLPTY